MTEKPKPKIGDVVLVDGDPLYEAEIVGVLNGYESIAIVHEREYYKIKAKCWPRRQKWISEYYIKGIVSRREA